jgi:hypothetical protein
MLMELLYRFCRIIHPQIVKLAGGIGYSAVSQAKKILRERIVEEPALKEQFNEDQDKLSKSRI